MKDQSSMCHRGKIPVVEVYNLAHVHHHPVICSPLGGPKTPLLFPPLTATANSRSPSFPVQVILKARAVFNAATTRIAMKATATPSPQNNPLVWFTDSWVIHLQLQLQGMASLCSGICPLKLQPTTKPPSAHETANKSMNPYSNPENLEMGRRPSMELFVNTVNLLQVGRIY